MIAVLVNCAAIIVGSIIGLLIGKKLNSSFSSIVSTGAGALTLVLGIQMALKYDNIVILALSIILGGIVGTWWNIDGKILQLGVFLEKHFDKKSVSQKIEATSIQSTNNFAYAFLNSSVLFAVGAMAIVGSFKAGVEGDYTIIFTKSILDGFLAIVFAASMGTGTIFSALTIFVYQGLLTVLSKILAPYVTEVLLNEFSAVGGLMIVMIGINLMGLKTIKTANYLPSMILVVFFLYIRKLFF